MDRQNADQAAQEALFEKTVVTLLTPLRGRPNKGYGPEGKRWDYDSNLATFKPRQVVVNDIDHFHELIGYWAAAGDSLIIPGQIRPDAGPIVNRRKLPDPNKQYPPDVIEAPVTWACFDVDYLPLPINVRSSPKEAAQFVIEQIAQIIPGFDQTSLVVQASNSCGQPGNEYIAKFHFWFLLARPWMLAKLKECIKQANQLYRKKNPELAARHKRETEKDFKLLDDALLQACQPHFVANPLFVDGAVDPMTQRIWEVKGEVDRLEIDPQDFITELVGKDGSQEYRTASRSNVGKTENTAQKNSDSKTKKKKVTHPADITGNSSRNRYFLHKTSERMREQGPQFDRQPLIETLREDIKKSNAEIADIHRWSSDTYLRTEIENCVRFILNQGHQNILFGLTPGPHDLQEFSERFLPPLPSTPGVLLIKSPMSSGKTWGLKQLLLSGRRVLVITHRQSLARDLSRRLNLFCYLDGKDKRLNQDRMVICLNSLHRVSYLDFDIVVIEESEQLLRHLSGLTSIKERPQIIHESFERCIREARQVVCLDAQLSNLSLHTMEFLRPNEQFTIWRNAFRISKKVRMYEKRGELIAAFESAVEDRSLGLGKPVALATNSKTIAHQQYERIRKDYPHLKCVVISSHTNGDPEIKNLLQDFDKAGSEYDVILSSPTMSSGVSIERLDFQVFGLFDANITCHTDCAQAISRFRLAKELDVFVAKGNSPTYRASQIVDTRLRTLRNRDIYFANDGSMPSFRADLFLRVQAYEEQSKGLLRQNFLSLADESGWSVEFIGFSLDKMSTGGHLIESGRVIEEQVRIDNLQAVERLTDSKLDEISSKNLPSSLELDAVERTRMEQFYYRPISPDLILRDKRGAYRKALRNLELLQETNDELIAEDRALAIDLSALPLNFRSKGVIRELLPIFLRVVGLPEDGRLDRFEEVDGQLILRPSTKHLDKDDISRPFEGWTKKSLNKDTLKEIERSRLEIKAFLGRSVPHNFWKNPVGFINQTLKECLAVPISSTRPRAGQGRDYHYSLDYSRLKILNADRHRRNLGLMGLLHIDDPDF